MSQLDICSRREADEWTRQGRILVHGETAVLGFKVDPSLVNENDIVILTNSELRDYRKNNKHNPAVAQQQYRKPRHDIDFASIVLHKPVGYVSPHHFRSVISVLFDFRFWNGIRRFLLECMNLKLHCYSLIFPQLNFVPVCFFV